MASPSLSLSTKIAFPDGRTAELLHPLDVVLSAGAEVTVVGVRLPSERVPKPLPSGFPDGVRVEADVRLPQTVFLSGVLPAHEGVNWHRTVLLRRGLFCALLDELTGAGETDARREDIWAGDAAGWKVESLSPSLPQSPASAFHFCMAPALSQTKPKLSLAAGRFIRFTQFRKGALLGLGGRDSLLELRNIRLRAEAFYLHEEGFALLNATELSYSGRPLLESKQPVSIEFDFRTGIGTVEGQAAGELLFHGGNMPHTVEVVHGRTELEIVGLSRKSDWWNVVMAAAQKMQGIEGLKD